MNILSAETINTNFNTPPAVYQSGGAFKMEIPQSSVMVAKPLTYQFRVAEHVDTDGNIKKVGLQVRVWEHNNYGGTGIVKHDWTDVERVQLPFVE